MGLLYIILCIYKHGLDGLKPPRTDHFSRRVLALERALKDSVAADLAPACQGVLEMRLGPQRLGVVSIRQCAQIIMRSHVQYI